jgi:hypothetical protein
VVRFSAVTSDVAVAAFVAEHPANRPVTHPRAANPSLDRALGPINGVSHIR